MLMDLYRKMKTDRRLSLEDAMTFVALAADKINPSVRYDPEATLMAIQAGLGEELLSFVMKAVERNPGKVGFQVTEVYSKDGRLLKIMTKRCTA